MISESSHTRLSAQDIIRLLNEKPFQLIGSAAGSSFQSEPIIFNSKGETADPVSDWENDLYNYTHGKPSHIKPLKGVLANTPRFLPNKEQYVNRSAELRENTFRFSFSMDRLCPQEYEFNIPLMQEYVRTLVLIRQKGMEPLVTLHHFTMPLWLCGTRNGRVVRGAWENPDVLRYVDRYITQVVFFLSNPGFIKKAMEPLGLTKDDQDRILSQPLVNYFMTFNEPSATLANSHIFGLFPPYRILRPDIMFKTLDRMVTAHEIMSDRIKNPLSADSSRTARVGIGYPWQCADGMLGSIVRGWDEYITGRFEKSVGETDFIGLHYYCQLTLPTLNPKKREWTDMELYGNVYPEGIISVLKRMHAAYPKKQILISEFGFADRTDKKRPLWILDTVYAVLEAKKLGIPIMGLLFWSLASNFEWNWGMTKKFGLFSEEELSNTLSYLKSPPDKLRSWEAWQAAVAALRNPTKESVSNLEWTYQRALNQREQMPLNNRRQFQLN